MVNKDFFLALNQLEAEGKIDKQLTLQALEGAIAQAYKKEFGEGRNITVQINEDRFLIRVIAYKTVVDEVENPENQISLENAQKIKPSYKVGDIIGDEISPKDFSRIVAQSAKQVFTQRITDENKRRALEDMSQKEGEIVTALIRRIDSGAIHLEVSGMQMEAVMLPGDQCKNETYAVGMTIKVYVKSVGTGTRGTRVLVSRSHKDFVKRLFELEVPEIKAGLVKIRKIVREAGYRTKLAVYSDEPGVDAVGACIGQKGIRINSVVQELHGEKIDVIGWCADQALFIARSLSPAQVNMVKVNEEDKTAIAIVPDEKLSLAIGKQGQNVRLAAKLTDWKIDVKPMSAAAELIGEED